MNCPPPVTAAHLQAAFEAMHWSGWTYTAALADPVRGRVLRARAAQLRTIEWQATTRRTVVRVPRLRLGADGHPIGWCTQVVAGEVVERVQRELLA